MKPHNAKSRWMPYAKGDSVHNPQRCRFCALVHGKGRVGGSLAPDGGRQKIKFGGRQNARTAAIADQLGRNAR